MAEEIKVIEERLKSFLCQFLAECGVLDRLVYKNKNQHRRSNYFQHLLKVRRDSKLLRSARLEELLESCFHVITGRKVKQKVHLLESLKRGKLDSGKFNFVERLLGAARLLSQMIEPIVKAAIEISKLLARSFFMGFSLTIMALLARIRVLGQQMLLDIVSVFNEVCSIAQKKQSVKISQDGPEVFREYYPTMEEVVVLETVWQTDQFVLVEKLHKVNTNFEDSEPLQRPATLYHSVEAFLGDGEPGLKRDSDSDVDQTRRDDDFTGPQEVSEITEEPPNKKARTGVAFVSVKKPAAMPPSTSTAVLRINEAESREDNDRDDGDPFFSLLAGGTKNASLF